VGTGNLKTYKLILFLGIHLVTWSFLGKNCLGSISKTVKNFYIYLFLLVLDFRFPLLKTFQLKLLTFCPFSTRQWLQQLPGFPFN